MWNGSWESEFQVTLLDTIVTYHTFWLLRRGLFCKKAPKEILEEEKRSIWFSVEGGNAAKFISGEKYTLCYFKSQKISKNKK